MKYVNCLFKENLSEEKWDQDYYSLKAPSRVLNPEDNEDRNLLMRYFYSLLSGSVTLYSRNYCGSAASYFYIMPGVAIYSKNKDGKIFYRSIFEPLLGDDFDIASLYKDTDSHSDKNIILSMMYNYYIATANYKKAFDTIKKFDSMMDNDIAPTLIITTKGHYYHYYNDITDDSNSAFILPVLYFYAKSKATKKELPRNFNNFTTLYFEGLTRLSKINKLDNIFSDKFLTIMHCEVMKKYFKNVEADRYNIFKNTIFNSNDKSISPSTILDVLETSPYVLKEFLNYFPDNSEKGLSGYHYYRFINSRDDTKVKKFIKELDANNENKERFKEILHNYLYSQYGLGQKYAGLQSDIDRIFSMLHILDYEDDISILEIIDGLPDKIQTAALKSVID